MTLAIALRCADGLVMASDSRVTGGPTRSADISEKFLQLNRDVGIMTYGLAVPGYVGIRQLREEVRQNPATYPTMTAITNRAATLFPQIHQGFIQQNPGVAGEIVGFIIAGFDGNDTSQFRIFSCDSRGNFNFEEVSGPSLMAAQWHLAESLYRLLAYPGMAVQEGLRVAVLLMVLTSSFESTVGGPIHLATATLDEGFTLLHEREVSSLIREVQPYLVTLKRAWIEAWSA